jgi:4-hydroxy-3-methylbut-2-enyl diphosphate reductase
MERLSKMGLNISQDLDSSEEQTIFVRTHGEIPETYKRAQERGIKIIDATCVNVRHSQEVIALEAEVGRRIYIFGKRKHPEVIGLLGYCRGNGVVIENPDEISDIPNIPSLLIPQTTADPQKFQKLRQKMTELIADLKVYNAICPFVAKREKELKRFAKTCDAIIFVGGKHSSNTAVLFAVCKSVNPNSYYVESPYELPLTELNNFTTIGISGSASTPMWQLQEIANFLQKQINLPN